MLDLASCRSRWQRSQFTEQRRSVMNLTVQQLQAVNKGEPLRFIDREVGQEFVVVRADVFDRVRLVFDDTDLDLREALPLVWQAMKEDWEDPSMDAYDFWKLTARP